MFGDCAAKHPVGRAIASRVAKCLGKSKRLEIPTVRRACERRQSLPFNPNSSSFRTEVDPSTPLTHRDSSSASQEPLHKKIMLGTTISHYKILQKLGAVLNFPTSVDERVVGSLSISRFWIPLLSGISRFWIPPTGGIQKAERRAEPLLFGGSCRPRCQ